MKMTKRAICLLLAAVMALALTIPVLAADAGGSTKTITLHAGDQGTFPDGGTEYKVTATDNKLPVLPTQATPSRTGWTFNGWYTKEVKYEVQYGNPTADDYWRWVRKTDGQQIKNNEIPAGVTDLYADYTPTVITIKMYPCGWKGEYAPLITHRQYGTMFDSRVFGWNTKVNEAGKDDNTRYVIDDKWNNFTYLGWFSDVTGGSLIGDGSLVGTDALAGETVNVYMHWRNAAGKELQSLTDPGYEPEKGAQYVWFRDGEKKNIHLNDTVTLAVGTNPNASDPTGIEWSVDHGEIVSVTPIKTADGKATKEANIKGLQNGEAKITVKLNGISDTITVKVGHDFTIFIYGSGGSCTQKGSTQWKCSIGNCDVRENRTTDFVHSYANPMTYPATCTSEGYTVRACTKCPVVEKSNIIPAKGHQFEVTTETGCSGGKVTIRKCTVCGYTESDGAGDHPWAKESTIDKPPTCISTGSRSIHCTNPDCHAVKDVETIPATGKHNFPATWKTVIPAHWNQKGLEQRECPDCHTIETHVIDEVPNVPGSYPSGGGGGGAAPEETPTPSPSPEVTPTPGPEATPAPVPAPVDPPKTNNGTGWVYDEQTGIDYYFIDGQMKRNYWAADASASKWNFWYYVDEEGKLVRGLQYIENPNGTGWYMLQVDDKNGCRGRLLDGVLDTGIAGTGRFTSTRGVDYGKCTWTQSWGSYNAVTGLWSDGQSHR